MHHLPARCSRPAVLSLKLSFVIAVSITANWSCNGTLNASATMVQFIVSAQQVLLQADRAMRNHRAQSRTVLSVGLV